MELPSKWIEYPIVAVGRKGGLIPLEKGKIYNAMDSRIYNADEILIEPPSPKSEILANELTLKHVTQEDEEKGEIPDDQACIICFERKKGSVAILPCGHALLCKKCSLAHKTAGENCPSCRGPIQKCILIFGN